nr:MAG TPA: hypothetical protein [Caudoviricetes sp.]
MDCFHNRINLNKYLYPNRITEPYFSSVQAIRPFSDTCA